MTSEQELDRERNRLWAALDLIADIAEGSETVNSLPHIAKIARRALAPEWERATGTKLAQSPDTGETSR